MSCVRALLALLLLLPLLPVPAGATSPALTLVATGSDWSVAHLLGAPDGGVDVVAQVNGTPELRHVTPEGWTPVPSAVDLGPLARDADGRLYARTSNATWQGVAALDASGALPVLQSANLIGFAPDGLLTGALCGGRSCLALVDESHHARFFPDAGLPPVRAFSPEGALYGAAQDDILRLDYENGNCTTVAQAPGVVQALAFAQDGTAYVVARGDLTRLDLATGANETLLALPHALNVEVAFAPGRLWVALTPVNGPAEIGYVDLNVAGFRGFEPAFQPAPVPDLVARATLGPESSSGAATWRILQVSVTNEGPVAATAFQASASWGGTVSGFRQAWLNGTTLAPGESVSASFVVDTTLMVGDETAQLRIVGALGDDVQAGQTESDMANDLASVAFVAKVDTRDGLGL